MEEVFDTDAVSGVLHRPEQGGSDGIVLTHGAGSNASAPLLVRLARAFAEAGYLTLRFDLPFRRQRLKGAPSPATAARDREGIALAVQAMKQMAPGRVFAGGHSYGGRQTAMTAAEQPGLAEALLLLSYLSKSEPAFSPNCACPRCSFTARAIRSARWRICGPPCH